MITNELTEKKRKAKELLRDTKITSRNAKAALDRVTAALNELEDILHGDQREHRDACR